MIVKIFNSIKCRVWNLLVQKYILNNVAKHGDDVTIGEKFSACGYEHIYIGNHVYIGEQCRFLCAEADIKIGNYVMFGPEVLIVTGNHRTDCVGEYMFNVKEKLPKNDQPVLISDDVWVGARAIILKGSKIGKGSVIAAGAIVSGEVPEYSIYLGKKDIRPRFNEEELVKHQEAMSKYENIR